MHDTQKFALILAKKDWLTLSEKLDEISALSKNWYWIQKQCYLWQILGHI